MKITMTPEIHGVLQFILDKNDISAMISDLLRDDAKLSKLFEQLSDIGEGIGNMNIDYGELNDRDFRIVVTLTKLS